MGNSRKRIAQGLPPLRIAGYENRIYKKKKTDGEGNTIRGYVKAEPNTPRSIREDDCWIHLYDRTIGFKKSVQENNNRSGNAAIDQDNRLATAESQKKSGNALDSQGVFECWVFECAKDTDYHKFLVDIKNSFDDNLDPLPAALDNKIVFMKPAQEILVSFMMHLKREDTNEITGVQGRGMSFGGANNHMSGVSSMCTLFGAGPIDRQEARMQRLLSVWEEDDIQIPASAFDMEKDLPILYEAMFTDLLLQWGTFKCVMVWTCILLMISVMGRVSCVTQHCPTWADVEFPRGPAFIEGDFYNEWWINWKNWKCRKKNHIGKDYKLRIKKNRLNMNYCLINFMSWYVSLLQERGYDLDGTDKNKKIFEFSNLCLGRYLKEVFNKAAENEGFEHLRECTSHSFRRSAAQWAKRCGRPLDEIMDIGRWSTVEILKLCLAYGDDERATATMGGAVDPIQSIWVCETEVLKLDRRGRGR